MASKLNLFFERYKKYEPFLYLFLILVLLFPFLADKYFLTQDGSGHIYNAKILLDYITNQNTKLYNEYYRSNIIAFPYWFGHLFIAFLLWIFPMIIVEKLIFSIYIVLFAYFTRKVILLINKDSLFAAYLILPFACTYGFQWGFIPFIYSFLFFCWIVAFWLKHKSDFLTNHAIKIGLLFLLVYFTHAVFWLFSLATVFVLLGFSILSNTTGFKSFFDEIVKSLRVIGLLLLSIIPSFVLYYMYFKKNPIIDLKVKFFTQEYIVNNIIKLKTIVLVNDNESKYAICLTIVLFLLINYSLVKKFQSKKITIYDGFYFAAFFALVIDIYTSINIIGQIERLHFLPMIFLIFWFASIEFHSKIKIFVIFVSFIITIGLVSARYPSYKRGSLSVEELLSAQPYIKENKTILFLGYNKIGIGPDKKEITSLPPSDFIKLEIFINSGCYMGISKPLVVLDNIPALYPQFPFMWRPEKCAFFNIQQTNSSSGILGDPPDVDLISYAAKTKGSIDYVVLRNFDIRYADNPKTINLFRQLNLEYKEIFVSESGIVKLFKKITAEDIINDINLNATIENYIKLCRYYYFNGEYDKCIEISDDIISKFPLDKEAYAYCGASYIKLDKMQKSITYLTKSLKLSPDFDFAYKKLQIAKNLFQIDSILNVSQNPQQLVYLSSIYYSNMLYEKCITSCEKALIYSPNNADAYNNICSAYNCLREWEKATEACKKALEIKPDYELVKNNLRVAEEGLKTVK